MNNRLRGNSLIHSWHQFPLVAALSVAPILIIHGSSVRADVAAIRIGRTGALLYNQDDLGNRVPDFSMCGFAGAQQPIPDVRAREVVGPVDGDDGAVIQNAIDRVAKLPLDASGFRGAVLLTPGEFQIAGQLRISASGIVLRGAGAGANGTQLMATGKDRRALVRIFGTDDRKSTTDRPLQVVTTYCPVGAEQLTLESTDGLRVGDHVLVIRPSTAEWIAELGVDVFGVGWRPGSRDIRWDREVTAIDGNSILIDAPITTAIEPRFGGATVQPYIWPGRIERVGIEDLRLVSPYAADNPVDEEHAWFGVTLQDVQNAWVRRVEFRHFAGGAVSIFERAKWVTVEDCLSLAPVSELAGYRRHTYFTHGQLTLFHRCWSEEGRHDFAVGHCAAGPNAFVHCFAKQAHDSSGPIESWASGVLYDNVRIDGGGLRLENRWADPPGTGWSAANCVLWQCRAAEIRCFRPPTGNNWAFGIWGVLAGDGEFEAESNFVRPHSLYQAQLEARVGNTAAERLDPILGQPQSATNPSLEEAAEFTARSNRPASQLIDVIRANMAVASNGNKGVDDGLRGETASVGASVAGQAGPNAFSPTKPISIRNGWLVVDGALKTGDILHPTWWRGTIRPDEALRYGPAITRFVPGRIGTGFTDDLTVVAESMLAFGTAVYDHHYGLWYDRRRDDHLMVRRADATVAPPFYEQPFARTGIGKAWDGLSKYDLSKPNPWYWHRLHDFAELCDRNGLVLYHQNYFQHNILEAGAHWVDSPWRPANNVNDTPFPEPPPFIGDKRIFMAEQFYDLRQPRIRELHRSYIRQCLDNFADCTNVVQSISAEYAGPLEFTQFWIDTIAEWEEEHHRDTMVALSCTKDVQDAILADPDRAPYVDVIDIRYWIYADDGELYAPQGGQNLAPRQHLRQTRVGPASFDSMVRAVREYRRRFPEKAVTYYADKYCRSGRDGWAVLMGGGSLPNIVGLPTGLAQEILAMQPIDDVVRGPGNWCLVQENQQYLVYWGPDESVAECHVPVPDTYHVTWIDSETGRVQQEQTFEVTAVLQIPVESSVMWIRRASGSSGIDADEAFED